MGKSDRTEYGKWLEQQLDKYKAERCLIIDNTLGNRCPRHCSPMEIFAKSRRLKLYTCPGCIEELAARQLALKHEWEGNHNAKELLDQVDVLADADPW